MAQYQSDPRSREELEQAWLEYLNRAPFSYDAGEDPLYQQYREQYIADGKRAMEDTVGLASTLTGGYANSYAQIAGQQSYERYLDRLRDVIPDLYESAYSRYQAEGKALYDEILLRQKELEKTQTVTTGGSTGSSGSSTGNSGYSKAVVMKAQELVGAAADGIWGTESAQKAARYGFYSLKDVVDKGLNISYDYVKKTMLKQLGHDRGVITEYDFLVARNNDGGPEVYLKYKDYRAYLMDVLRQIYA